MSEGRDTLLLKGVVGDLIERLWKTQFYNDVEDYILYIDPQTKSTPRSEEEIKQIHSELNRVKEDVVDEIIEDLKANGITKIEDIIREHSKIRNICHERFSQYRRRFWDVIKPGFSAE